MKMNKKFVSLTMVAMMGLSLAACGDNGSESADNNNADTKYGSFSSGN